MSRCGCASPMDCSGASDCDYYGTDKTVPLGACPGCGSAAVRRQAGDYGRRYVTLLRCDDCNAHWSGVWTVAERLAQFTEENPRAV